MRYVFHVHQQARAWRLVTAEGAPLPAGCRAGDWAHSRTREADDTGADVRREVDARGYLLFKLGGELADVQRDLQAEGKGGALSQATAPSAAKQLEQFPVHLGLGATACVEPEFTGMDWYERYGARHAADGADGRLVSMFSFDASWGSWEVHPHGGEVVLCTTGAMTMIQEIDGAVRRTKLESGQYAINPPGVWHTVDTDCSTTAVFITAGIGTQHRPR